MKKVLGTSRLIKKDEMFSASFNGICIYFFSRASILRAEADGNPFLSSGSTSSRTRAKRSNENVRVSPSPFIFKNSPPYSLRTASSATQVSILFGSAANKNYSLRH